MGRQSIPSQHQRLKMPADPRALIDAAPMSATQIRGIAILAALSALDGYDVLAVTFAAPGFNVEFGLGKGILGLALSMGLLGMALGSLLLAPIADLIGRRPMVLISLAAMAAGMFLSATAENVFALSVYRILTGLGIGSMVAVTNPLAAELANAKRRDLAVGVTAIGYPLGGVVGGLIAALLLHYYSWRAVFLLGGGAAVLLAPIAFRWLPESIAYLVDVDAKQSLARPNATLLRRGNNPLVAMPEPLPIMPKLRSFVIFRREMIARTLHVTGVNFLYVITVYYLLSWMPQMVADAGFPAAAAASVSVCANLGGVIGGVLLGALSPRIGLKPCVVLAVTGAGIFTVLFGALPANLALLRTVAACAGFFLFGGIVGLYAIIARTFAAPVRASGTGFVIGVGRGGSAAAPALAGLLFVSGYDRFGVSIVMGSCAILAAIALFFLPVSVHAR
ncbi:MAG: hypothetical protein JWR80_8266 [Bradyrhizobium sp.]|nr:hypothetical protein [Bradyrhizobium sp.]